MKQRAAVQLEGETDDDSDGPSAIGFDDDESLEEAFALDGDESEEETEDCQGAYGAGLHTGELSDGDSEDVDEEDEKDDVDQHESWGAHKRDYYNADADAEEEEEAEALRLQRQQALAMDDAAFVDLWQTEGEGHVADGGMADAEDAEALLDDGGNVSIERITKINAEAVDFAALCEELKKQVAEMQTSIQPLLQKYATEKWPRDEVSQFLATKNQLFLVYQTNVLFLMYLKASNKIIKDHPALQRLIHYRVLLDKMKPLEERLQQKMEKLMGKLHATEVSVEEEQKLAHKPRLGDLMTSAKKSTKKSSKAGPQDSGDDSDARIAADEDDDDERVDVYRPPKVNPVFYDESDRKGRKEKRDRKKSVSDRMLAELQDEFEIAPETMANFGSQIRGAQQDKTLTDRQRFEEENFMRMIDTKADKRRRNEAEKYVDELKDLVDFNDIQAVAGGMESSEEEDNDIRHLSKRRKQSAGEFDESDMDDDNEVLSDDSSDMYGDAVAAAKARKTKKQQTMKSKYEPAFDDYAMGEEYDESGKRQINRTIEKNKGLTELNARKKENRNPRVKHRRKFEKGLKKLQSIKANTKSHNEAYGGEKTGIRKNVAKSVKF